jgi:hypothetical protein
MKTFIFLLAILAFVCTIMLLIVLYPGYCL